MLHFLLVFLSGGVLCAIAQLLIDFTKLTPARILVIYVVAGVLVGALGLYEPMRERFASGVTVPLFGFGGNIAVGVRDAVRENGFLGIFSGALTAAAGGSSAALCFGYLAALFGKSKPKRL